MLRDMAHPSGVKLRFSRDKATGQEFVAWEQRGKRPEGPARAHSVPVQAACEPEAVGLLSGAGAPSPAENPPSTLELDGTTLSGK